ncbi:SEC-C metal-binding domain-containing protein [Candidatus Xianfuyuplasma coldseepsis]|uniref:SEC-C motif-containing protein n=1 Tax=Candidatus Xianfuyuplasma coldseepsis TaxID=2782163 RepID=A0A7L7KP94_9MOLU|nr:SEC-C metal-binding domain-containing protein [Xianfuyuplasma coldseepsis]QMS84513.1 hypothetical protein G4Z02_01700 [Xianfuyuplasma coldseepsis]
MNDITKYVIAATNLYGMVTLDKVVEVYRYHHDNHIPSAEPIDQDLLEKHHMYYDGEYFYTEAMSMNTEQEWQQEKQTKRNKPYYIPTQDELLFYIDNEYEENDAYFDLLEFIETIEENEVKVINVCYEIRGMAALAVPYQRLLNIANEYDIIFPSDQDFKTYATLVKQVHQHTRRWNLNGYTLAEYNQLPKPHKVGRNDPCQCGSGKKYKKCCGK